MPTTQFTLRTTYFQPHEARYWEARKRAFSEIAWFETAAADARLASDHVWRGEDDGFTELAMEPWHGAADAAEWLLENPNAVAILRAQGRLCVVEQWAAMRPVIEELLGSLGA